MNFNSSPFLHIFPKKMPKLGSKLDLKSEIGYAQNRVCKSSDRKVVKFEIIRFGKEQKMSMLNFGLENFLSQIDFY